MKYIARLVSIRFTKSIDNKNILSIINNPTENLQSEGLYVIKFASIELFEVFNVHFMNFDHVKF